MIIYSIYDSFTYVELLLTAWMRPLKNTQQFKTTYL